jgi:hypothetical protein
VATKRNRCAGRWAGRKGDKMTSRNCSFALLMIFAFAFVVPAMMPDDGYCYSTPAGKYSVAGLDDEKEVAKFFVSFRDAVKNHEKAKVAGMIAYPIQLTLASGKVAVIKSPKAFIKKYDEIFDRIFTDALSKKSPNELWANSQGVATASGEIWLGDVLAGGSGQYQLKITAINGVTARH